MIPAFLPPGKDPYDCLMLGRRALDEGRLADANAAFTMALAFDPSSTKVIELLLETAAGDADARTLWSHAFYAAAADAAGRVAPDRPARDLLAPGDPHLKAVALARARAAAELAAFAKDRSARGSKEPDQLLVAAWARAFALDLSRPAAALLAGPARGCTPKVLVPEGFYRPVIAALEALVKNALAAGDGETAVRAARILRGLGVQAGFKDLKGPRPAGMNKVRREGAAGLARARRMIAKKIGEPLTVEELEAMTPGEAEAFTRDHATFANPGVAVSPGGLYRIETDCGYETLLGVARTVEYHHARLARWFRQDPFKERQGIVRIVPEAAELESEGAPFWWAGGFQGGDVTTLRFSCGTIEGLGHGLTHELTHRFDGAIHPGMPAWLMEGRAVWTASSYGSYTDRSFVPNHVNFGTMESTFLKGYGSLQKLTKLIEGTIEEYRDNYVAGYALYVYLDTWEEEGRKLYAGPLLDFMGNARKGIKNPKAFFEKHFADGKEGRPKGLKEFAARFHDFIQGFYWKTRKPFTRRYTTKVPTRPVGGYVFDEPTWTWSRVRAEPFFGQDQGLRAGRLLLEEGSREAGIRALVWGLSVDGRTPWAERLLARTLRDAGRRDGAWVAAWERAFPFGAPPGKAPFLAALRQVRIFLSVLEEAAGDYLERGLPFAAAALAADRDRFAARLGLPALDLPPPPADKGLLHPFDPPARHLGLAGWEDAGLSRNDEEFRVKNLWFAADNGDLHVGRKKPRRGTGLLDRSARLRHAFALAGEWLLPGAYRIRTRIKFTTSYVSGAVVLGWTRRDHNVRFGFSAGDLMYAIGESEKEPAFKAVHWRLEGLRERDGPLTGSVKSGAFEFGRSKPAFDLELLVEGAAVEAFIDGKSAGVYHTVDGAPIAGRVGFAAGYGAFCAQRPVAERLDRSWLARRPGAPFLGLDIARGRSRPFKGLENLPVYGLPPSPNGRLLLWIPMPWLGSGGEFDPEWAVSQALYAASLVDDLIDRDRVAQPFAVALPRALGAERIAALKKELKKKLRRPPLIVTHAFPGWTKEAPDSPDEWLRWIIFLDPLNVARVVQPYEALHDTGLSGRLGLWLQVF